MLNKFTYQLELNKLNQCTTKTALKELISKYNTKAFSINSNCKIILYLPIYTHPQNTNVIESKIRYFQLIQLAITKWQELGFPLSDLPIYAQQLAQITFNITLKE